MANPQSVGTASAKVPKLIQNTRYKVRRDVADTTQETIPTSTVLPSFQDRVIHFKIEKSSTRCINLSLLKINLELMVQSKHLRDDEAGGGEGVKAIIPGSPFASLFRDVVIKCNGIPITETNGFYPYISQHLLLTKVHPVYRKVCEESGRICYDHEDTKAMTDLGGTGHRTVGLNSDLWKNLEIRQERFQIDSQRKLDLSLYIFTDLTCGPTAIVLPPTVSIEIELHPNSPQRSIILDKVGLIEPVVAITRAELTLPRVTPNNGIPRTIQHQFMKITAQPLIIPQNSTNYNGVVTFPGKMPSRLSLIFASMKSYDGDYASNMYASYPRAVESIAFNVAGRQYPSIPVHAQFDDRRMSNMYLRTCESLRFSLDRTKKDMPTLDQYASNQFLYCVDISSDYSSDSTWTTNPNDHGSVAVSIHFAKPTTDQCVAILLAETVATLSVSSQGDIALE